MELVVRGLLWTTGNLTEDGKPAATLAKQGLADCEVSPFAPRK